MSEGFGRRAPASVAVLGAAAAATVVVTRHLGVDSRVGTLLGDVAWIGGGVLAAAMCWSASRHTTLPWRRTWVLLAVAGVLWTTANALAAWYEVVLGRQDTSPLPPRFADLAARLAAVAAAWAVVWPPAGRPRIRLRGAADAALVLAGVAQLFQGPFGAALASDRPSVAFMRVFLATDVALVVVAGFGLAHAWQGASRVSLLLVAAVASVAVGDVVTTFDAVAGGHSDTVLRSLFHFAGYACLAFAGATRLGLPPEPTEPAPRWAQATPFALFGAGLVVSLAREGAQPRSELAGHVLTGLLVARLLVAVLDNQRESAELERRVRSRTSALRASEAAFRAVTRLVSDAVVVLEPDLIVRYLSPAVERLVGVSNGSLHEASLVTLLHPDDLAAIRADWEAFSSTPGATRRMAVRIRNGPGVWRDTDLTIANLIEDPDVAGFVVAVRDVTEQRTLERSLRHRAEHDDLTGLANRRVAVEQLDRLLASGCAANVLLLDLDRFKEVNDSLGHAVGDDVLRAVASRLERCVPEGGVLCRLDGDEFAIVSAGDERGALAMSDGIRDGLAAPVQVGDRSLRVQCSAGLSCEGATADVRLRNATLAVHEAKVRHSGSTVVYSADMHARLVRRLELEHALRPVADRSLEVHYMPLVHLESGAVVGAEALLRWRRDGSLVEPEEFIPVAEAAGLMGEIGAWVLGEACAAAARWPARSGFSPRIAVNVSPVQLADGAFASQVAEALAASGLPPDSLTLELTETAIMGRSDSVFDELRALRRLGVRLSIDDFGTGYSSLGRLQFLPVQEVKIDRAFVRPITDWLETVPVIDAVVALAGSLDLAVVAEGIETPAQLALVRRVGCQIGQGYLFGRAMPAAEVGRLMANPKTWQ